MIKFFILAGGVGTRAQPLSDIKPKVLFPLNGIPLLDHMLNNIYLTGVKEGFINVFHLAEQIEKEIKGKTGLSIIPEKKLSGNLILKTAFDPRDKPDLLLIVNGDVFTSIPLKEMYQRLQLKKADGIILTKPVKAGGYNSIIEKDGLFYGRGKSDPEKSSLLYTGIALLKKEVIKKIDTFNMFDFFEKENLKILLHYSPGLWLDIGDPLSYFQSNFTYKEFINDPAGNSFSPGCSISANSNITRSIIWEEVIINNSSIKNCIIANNIQLNSVTIEDKIVTKKENKIFFNDLKEKILN